MIVHQRNMSSLICLITVLIGLSVGLEIPKYIRRCNLLQPNLSQCFSDGANIAIPNLVKGNEQFGIPPLSRFKIDDVHSPLDSSFTFSLQHASAGYLENARYIFSNINRVAKIDGNGTLYIPELHVFGRYNIDGEINGVRTQGGGFADITLNGVYCKLTWNLIKVQKRNAKVYFEVVDLGISYEIQGATYSLSDLSVGGRSKNDANGFLNQNWQALARIVAPSVIKGIRDTTVFVVKSFTDKVPIIDMFDYTGREN